LRTARGARRQGHLRRRSLSSTPAASRRRRQGQPVTKQVKVLWKKGDKDAPGKPIDPSLIGTVRTTSPRPAIPAFDAPIAAAATEQAVYGYVTTQTVRDLQKLGYSVNQIPGLITENQARKLNPNPHPKTAIQAVPGLGGAAPVAPTPDQADRNRKR
jgi:hypothetical protein